MSEKHPIVSVYGSSGSGRSSVRDAFRKVCERLGLKPGFVSGTGFHKYNRAEMKQAQDEFLKRGEPFLTHFGPRANHWDLLEALFEEYGRAGTGRHRRYLHTEDQAADVGLEAGHFTPWEDLPKGTDLLVYEGLHGAVKTDTVDVGRHVDLKIGVAPIINLEWIQKISHDVGQRGYSENDVKETILARMDHYVHYILPQFHHSNINFQRAAVVDTSNPMMAQEVPKDDESRLVIRFRDPRDPKVPVDFPMLLQNINDSMMSRRNTIVVPGGEMGLAMELILPPILERLVRHRR